jgi:hypothetical protein
MKKTIFTIYFLFISAWLLAGWEITYRVNHSDGMVAYEVMLVSNNKIKYSGNDYQFIIDTDKEEMFFIMNTSKTFWKGSPKQFREEMNMGMKAMMDQMMAQVPEEQRAMYSEMLGGMSDMYKTPTADEIKKVQFDVTNTGESTNIAGYSSEKFVIKQNGQVLESLWISEITNLNDDYDPKKAHEMMLKIMPFVEDESFYEYTSKYAELISKGLLVKSEDPANETVEAIKIIEREIDPDELELPKGYRLTTIDQLLQEQMMGNGEDGNE